MRALLLALLIPFAGQAGSVEWPQWGGPDRNFQVRLPNPSVWPSSGPRRIWKRDVGFGHSSILVDGDRLYTMHRNGDEEAVIALDAATGKTVWEFSYPAPLLKGMDMSTGPGPHATPLLSGGRIFSTGVTGKLHAIDVRSGKPVWSRSIIEEFGGTVIVRGYSCSPLAYRDTVIVTAGGPGAAVIAFNQSDGKVAWKGHDFANSHASPILARVAGQDQLIAVLNKTIAGFAAGSGDLLWTYPHDTIGDHTAVTPVWGDDGLLFVSSAYDGGSRVVQLTRAGTRTTVTERWAHKRMRSHHSNVVRIGAHVYGTSGDFGPAFLQCVDIKTGEILWRDRTFARANTLHLGRGKALLLDEDGVLALVTLSPKGLEVHSRAEVLENKAWTPPSLAGKKLYLRDRKAMVALELP
jgi:outer membrane protein assembly factor BamB